MTRPIIDRASRAAAGFLLAAALAAPPVAILAGAGRGPSAADLVLTEQAAACLESGQAVLQWAPDPPRGYGSPLFLYRPPLAAYAAGAARWAGLPPAAAQRGLQAAALALSAATAFLLGRRLWGTNAGWLAAILASYVPARLGPALGAPELAASLALIWPALVLWGLHRHVERRDHLSWAVAAAGLAALLLSDSGAVPLLGVPTLLLGASLGLAPAARGSRASLAALPAAAIGATAFYWLPAWLESGLIAASRGPSAGGAASGWGHPLGLTCLALAGLGVVGGGRALRGHGARAGWATAAALMALALPVLLGLPGLGSLLAGAPGGPHDPALPLAVLLPLVVAPLPLLAPRRWAPAVPVVVAGLLAGVFALSGPPAAETPPRRLLPPIPRGVAEVPPARPGGRFQAPAGCRLGEVRTGSDTHFVDLSCREDALLAARVLYFPGWTAEVDKGPVDLRVDPTHGTIAVPVPAGTHRVKLAFEATPPRAAGRLLSLATLVAAAALLAVPRAARAGPEPRHPESSG